MLGMGKNLLFPLRHCVLQCSRESCDSFIITGPVFPCCVCLAWRDEPSLQIPPGSRCSGVNHGQEQHRADVTWLEAAGGDVCGSR